MKMFWRGVLLAAVVLITACSKEEETCTDCNNYEFNGEQRQYSLHVPANLSDNAPLVFVLHGLGDTAEGMEEYLKMNEIADGAGFVVCYPQGELDNEGSTHWNARLSISEVDDIGYLSDLAIKLQQEYNLNPQKTFVCGFSNGGFMSYTLVAEAPSIFKGAASITGTMSGYTWNNRSSISAAPVFQICGGQDDVIPVDGSLTTEGGWGGAPAMEEVIGFWSDLNEVTNETTEENGSLTVYKGKNAQGQDRVWYYFHADVAHEIPNQEDHGINTAALIWQFFEQF